ncbi:helix-turn-helix transcriptional regulator [Desulfuribacillus alkaliarsenatis]|uniref:Transcriptional regulator n=1 Tax=Desulfuribacillus alkaliarsenatis TaxID=766136 RepID=A0A1E5FZE5_9FIRM|nr:helix-turn-helix domain-containing protein [Desulfuribacillus alkaliarsenatis]OEF95872.1 transcriptional regulator [Desulfuribacillus alkaliarsenatis]
MNKEHVIELLSNKIKLIRTEKGYTQDRMAEVLGMSKKTLVQIEKQRLLASWAHIVTLVTLFRNSEVLESVLGDSPIEVIETIAHEQLDNPKEKTLGGRVWWKEIDFKGDFRLQQNVISQHYRILDNKDRRWYSSFDKQDALVRLQELHVKHCAIK